MSLPKHPTNLVHPIQNWPPELLLRAQNIRAVIFDVDGVLTDGGIYFDAKGEALKRFASLDGMGLELLHRAGIEPMVISGRDSAALRARLAALRVVRVALGSHDKLPVATEMLAALKCDWSEVAVMGDDWPDLPLLIRAAFACAPANAHAEVRARVHHVTSSKGGYGAVRELCDLLIAAAGRYRALLEPYVTQSPTDKAAQTAWQRSLS
jgi:3-deoxy-D-manno-octulosonate 8-phosphate phosphatase (KDO 8-P phosphatase)